MNSEISAISQCYLFEGTVNVAGYNYLVFACVFHENTAVGYRALIKNDYPHVAMNIEA